LELAKTPMWKGLGEAIVAVVSPLCPFKMFPELSVILNMIPGSAVSVRVTEDEEARST
jgi:hypothetical protein